MSERKVQVATLENGQRGIYVAEVVSWNRPFLVALVTN